MEVPNIQVNSVAPLLMSIINNPDESMPKLKEITQYLKGAPSFAVQHLQKYIIGALNALLIKHNSSMNSKTKSAITVLLSILFKNSKVDELKVFLFAYKYLLDQIYDHKQPNCVSIIDEEYKLEIIEAMIYLSRSLTWDVLEKVYDKDKALILCQMIYVSLEMAKSEQNRSLRIACIECIMCVSRVDDMSDFSDLELRCRIADIFILFLPGITTSLAKIAVEDEKHGHAVVVTALKAWGRIVTLQMQNYSAADEIQTKLSVNYTVPAESQFAPKTKWKTSEDVKQYLDNTKRTSAWYKETDKKLCTIMSSFSKLTHHSHLKVRKELLEICQLLIEYCSLNIPKTSGSIINHLIMLSEDENNDISATSIIFLDNLSCKLAENTYNSFFQNLEEDLYIAVMSLPRVFNSLDENEQISAINLIVGYLKVFGKTKLAQVLRLPFQVNHLLQGIIHISKFDVKDVRLNDDYMFEDLDKSYTSRTPWKTFRYFRKDAIQGKLQQACALLATCGGLEIAIDLLMEIFVNSPDDRKEATFLLNEMLFGLQGTMPTNHLCVIESVLDLYMDTQYINIPLEVNCENVISEVQDNIVQICLQLEGIGKIALVMKQVFEQKMLKTLYPIFEYAGSSHYLIKTAATLAITNISQACSYDSIYQLIHKNLDYLTYHILRKLYKRNETESALKALTTVLKYGNLDTLHYFVGDLLHSCDKFFHEHSLEAYLNIFHMVIKSIRNSLNIETTIEPIKSKKQKEVDHEPFYISNEKSVEAFQDSSGIDGYQENASGEDLFEDNCKKSPPMHIKLTEELLQRCIHFLPSKKRSQKILVIEIFKDGLEILRDWENTMLPLVHQVWSPLTDRFREQEDIVVINYSFQLLIVLARVSKDFIRSRTAKDVLPYIRQILTNLIKSSYLQDKGSAYRYTQAYKLQLCILQNLGRVGANLDLADAHIVELLKAVYPYLHKYQPIPIQESTLTFYSDLIRFDSELVKTTLEELMNALTTEEKLSYEKNVIKLLNFCK